jgi:hypothetical protein
MNTDSGQSPKSVHLQPEWVFMMGRNMQQHHPYRNPPSWRAGCGGMASRSGSSVRGTFAQSVVMICIDEIWLVTEPLDMRAGPDTALARVVQVFGSARSHCAYLFANKRGNRMKVLIHDGLGIWLCARRLNRGAVINCV